MPLAIDLAPEHVLAWLKANPGPQSASAIYRALGAKPSTVHRRLSALASAGQVTRTGGTSGRYVRWEAA